MPGGYLAHDTLNMQWIRLPSPEEEVQDLKWYRILEFRPASIIHSNKVPAGPFDTLGMAGNTVTVLQQAVGEKVVEVPCANPDEIEAPPTPPPPHLR